MKNSKGNNGFLFDCSHIYYTHNALVDLEYWKKNDQKKYEKIMHLISQIGKGYDVHLSAPKPLLGEFSGLWVRRIDALNRMVVSVNPEMGIAYVLACRFHETPNKERHNLRFY